MLKKAIGLLVGLVLGLAVQAAAKAEPKPQRAKPEDVLVLNAATGVACVMPAPKPPDYVIEPCPLDSEHDFFKQGHRTELQVFNRKFLTDFSITIDAVTELQTGPNIRNLNEAENLTLGAISLVTAPAAKGGAGGLSARTPGQILLDLLDESKASGPEEDLESDRDVLDRESNKILADLLALDARYTLLRGDTNASANDAYCRAALGAPDVHALTVCIEQERTTSWSDNIAGLETNEARFAAANIRVQDLVAAVKTLGGQLSSSDLPGRLKDIATEISQYENDADTFHGNAKAALDASRLAPLMGDASHKHLLKQQIKLLLLDKLKGSDSKPILDEAELNAVLDQYVHSYPNGVPDFIQQRWSDLENFASSLSALFPIAEFRGRLSSMRHRLEDVLSTEIAQLNASQSNLLNRVNYVYDNSEVCEPLPKQISLSGHSGNLIVYYTIRRIDTFQRYTVAQVQPPSGSAPAAGAVGTPLPPAKGAAPSPAAAAVPAATPATTPADQASGNPPPAAGSPGDTGQGTVVARGSFEVHDVFHANVVAAIAFSTLKDQSISKQPQPQACSGTTTTPDSNCFAPVLSGNNNRWAPIIGFDYYFQPRDTFPGAAAPRWFCSVHPWQCFGVMGAASATKANDYFLGIFFEPKLGVQLAGGANFGIRSILQAPYQFGTPVDITGDFPTHDVRATGAFVSAGLDLGIFRKVFGKLTGIGTSTTGTSGK